MIVPNAVPKGENIDNPKVVNLVQPMSYPLGKAKINGMDVDMVRFAEAAEKLGAQPGDVLSIGGYRNAKGQFVPDYSSVRIESRADDE